MAALKICMFLGILLVNIAADIIVEDWYSQKLKNISTLVTEKQSATGYESHLGYIRHWSSKKFIHPLGAVICPPNSNELVVYSGIYSTTKNSFKFVQVEGHYGYIRHSCGKDIHPKHEHLRPSEGMRVVFYDSSHPGALFYVDEEKQLIFHRGGGILSPTSGGPRPNDNDRLCIRYGTNDFRRFQFVDKNFAPMPVYPKPSLNGRWEVLFAVLDPLAHEHSYQIRYKVGRSVSRSATEIFAWKVSTSAALNWFKTSSEYSKAALLANSDTWTAEVTDKLDIEVKIGVTVVVWQYIFEANQFGDGLRFRSNILANTKDINIRPAFI